MSTTNQESSQSRNQDPITPESPHGAGAGSATPHDRLLELGLKLPDVPAPAYAYVPTTRAGNLLYVSGQISRTASGDILTGTVGETATLEEGIEAARTCALNLLARIDTAVGLDAVSQVLKLNGYVASAPGFYQQPTVIDGASQLLVDVLGERGRHARTALPAHVLPINALVEVEVVVAVHTQ